VKVKAELVHPFSYYSYVVFDYARFFMSVISLLAGMFSTALPFVDEVMARFVVDFTLKGRTVLCYYYLLLLLL